MSSNPLHVTDTILRDAHQSLLATRMSTGSMLPIAERLEEVGYWSLEMWGGATFDSAMRFLKENPWDRVRELKVKAPTTPFQMLLRGQNILGYRHYPGRHRGKSSSSSPSRWASRCSGCSTP